MSDIQDTNNIHELQSPFEQLREVDANGKEWWNSRKLARVMGYGKYCLKTTNILDTFESMNDCNFENTTHDSYIKQ